MRNRSESRYEAAGHALKGYVLEQKLAGGRIAVMKERYLRLNFSEGRLEAMAALDHMQTAQRFLGPAFRNARGFVSRGLIALCFASGVLICAILRFKMTGLYRWYWRRKWCGAAQAMLQNRVRQIYDAPKPGGVAADPARPGSERTVRSVRVPYPVPDRVGAPLEFGQFEIPLNAKDPALELERLMLERGLTVDRVYVERFRQFVQENYPLLGGEVFPPSTAPAPEAPAPAQPYTNSAIKDCCAGRLKAWTCGCGGGCDLCWVAFRCEACGAVFDAETFEALRGGGPGHDGL